MVKRFITDAGEKIGGSRKDFARERLLIADLADLTTEEKVKYVVKDIVFKRPDYAKLVEDGMDKLTAAYIKIIYDRLPKTVKPDYMEAYIQTLNHIEEIMMEQRDPGAFQTRIHNLALEYSTLSSAGAARGRVLYAKSNHSPLYLDSSDRTRARGMVSEGWPEAKREVNRRNDLAPLPTRRTKKKLTISHSYRSGDVTPEDFITQFGFRGVEFGDWLPDAERQQVLNDAYDAFMTLAEIMDIKPSDISIGGRLAVGFGSRGQGRAAAHYESVLDVFNFTRFNGDGSVAHEYFHALDDIMGDIKGTKRNGEVNGVTGWYKLYNRSYHQRLNPDSGAMWGEFVELMVKKPKTREDVVAETVKSFDESYETYEKKKTIYEGMLARSTEQHAIENCKRLMQQYEDAMVINRKDLERRMQRINELPENHNFGMQNTDYMDEAVKLNSNKASGYWTRPTELGARAFEAFVFDTMQDIGIQNDYLVHSVGEDEYASEEYRGNPYPTGEERKRINEYMIHLINDFKKSLRYDVSAPSLK